MHEIGVVRRDGEQRADAAVNMEPEVLSDCQISKGPKIIDRTGVDCPGIADHAGWLKAGVAVPRDHHTDGVKVDAEILVRRDALQRPISEPHRLDRFAMAIVHLVRGIEFEAVSR